MAFTLKQVVPWGRSFDEYRRMFLLSEDDLDGYILGCGDGPASFNAVASSRGARVVSCDPLYQFDAVDIRKRIEQTRERIVEQTRQNLDQFIWDDFGSVDGLAAVRTRAMDDFLVDFIPGRESGRYMDASLPDLPFGDSVFDLALCSHLLFLYSKQLSLDFHVRAVKELCRLAFDIRIFPLLALDGTASPYVAAAVQQAEELGFDAEVVDVNYEFQRGANKMLRLTAQRG